MTAQCLGEARMQRRDLLDDAHSVSHTHSYTHSSCKYMGLQRQRPRLHGTIDHPNMSFASSVHTATYRREEHCLLVSGTDFCIADAVQVEPFPSCADFALLRRSRVEVQGAASPGWKHNGPANAPEPGLTYSLSEVVVCTLKTLCICGFGGALLNICTTQRMSRSSPCSEPGDNVRSHRCALTLAKVFFSHLVCSSGLASTNSLTWAFIFSSLL